MGLMGFRTNSIVKNFHILSQNLKQVAKKGENYCVRVKRSGVYSWVPLEPQPSEADVVVLHNHLPDTTVLPSVHSCTLLLSVVSLRDSSNIVSTDIDGGED
jgi:hypothetical protein